MPRHFIGPGYRVKVIPPRSQWRKTRKTSEEAPEEEVVQEVPTAVSEPIQEEPATVTEPKAYKEQTPTPPLAIPTEICVFRNFWTNYWWVAGLAFIGILISMVYLAAKNTELTSKLETADSQLRTVNAINSKPRGLEGRTVFADSLNPIVSRVFTKFLQKGARRGKSTNADFYIYSTGTTQPRLVIRDKYGNIMFVRCLNDRFLLKAIDEQLAILVDENRRE